MLTGRTVHKLRVRARDEALIHRGQVLVADALRTATLPGSGAQLVLIRRLALPPFRAGSSPQSVALTLEARCGALASVTVAAGTMPDDALLAAAPAVCFPDTLQALLCLTRALLAGARPTAWCWPLVAPGYRESPALPDALTRVAAALARLPEQDRALVVWLDTVIAAGEGRALAAGLTRAPKLAGALPVPHGPLPPPAARPLAQWRQLLDELDLDGGAGHSRRWLQAMAPPLLPVDDAGEEPRAGSRPATRRVESRRAPPPAAPTTARANPVTRRHRRSPGGAPVVRGATASVPASAGDVVSSRLPRAAEPPGGEVRARAAPDVRPAPAGQTRAEQPALQPLDEPYGMPSVAGGLLFLIPVLERCGLRQWLAANPRWLEADLPAQILDRLLDRLRAPLDDALRALAPDPGLAPPASEALRLPRAWSTDLCRGTPRWFDDGHRQAVFDASGRLPLALWHGEAPPGWPVPAGKPERRRLPATGPLLADAWINACRRRLRRQARIGIATLARRRSRVGISVTNVDVWLPSDSVSLPVRRSGLDVDPGWVPWLGRVVRFHYSLEGW